MPAQFKLCQSGKINHPLIKLYLENKTSDILGYLCKLWHYPYFSMRRLESLFAKGRTKPSLPFACEKLQSTHLYSAASLIKMIDILNPNYPRRWRSWERRSSDLATKLGVS